MRTDAFTLPSGTECEIREFDGKTEKLFSDKSLVNSGRVIDLIIARSLVSLDGKTISNEHEGEEAALNMLSGDRNFLLVKIRVLNYGPEMYINHRCPVCGEWAGYELNLEEILADEDEPSLTIRPFNPPVTVELSNGDKAELRDMTGRNERRLAALKEVTALDVEMSCVASINGEKPKRGYFDNLPVRDLSLIRDTYAEKLNGGLDGTIYLTCRNCNAENEVFIASVRDFFAPRKMNSARRSRS